MATRRDRMLLEDTVDWDAFGNSYQRVSDMTVLSKILFQVAAEPGVPVPIFEDLARQVTSVTEDRWQVEKEPWAVNEISRVVCGIWATYLTQVPMRFLNQGRTFPQLQRNGPFNSVLRVLPAREEEICYTIQSLEDLQGKPEALECWRKTEQLLTDFGGWERFGRSKGILHVMVRWGFPNWLIWLAAKLHPEQLRESDKTRGLPIHFCSCGATKKFQVDNYKIQFSDRFEAEHPELNRPTSVFLLSKLYPEGASTSFAEEDRWNIITLRGKLPLHTYLGYMYERSPNNGQFDLEDVQMLVQLAPLSLSWKTLEINTYFRTTVSYMFPFMIAASRDESRWRDAFDWHSLPTRVGETRREIEARNWNRIHDKDLEQVNTIYWLLRQDPSVLQAAMQAHYEYPSTQDDVEFEKAKHKFLGKAIAKHFWNEKKGAKKMFFGKITGVIHASNTEIGQMLFSVQYDDGDAEDMNQNEVEKACQLYMKWKEKAQRKRDAGPKSPDRKRLKKLKEKGESQG